MKSLPGILWLAATPTLLIGQSTYFAPPVSVQQWSSGSPSSTRCEFADIDGDGVLDIIGIGASWFLRGPTSFAIWSTPVSNPCIIVGFGDFDRDGQLDVLGATSTSYYVNIYNFDPATQRLQQTPSFGFQSGGPRGMAVADFNNDGWPDIANLRHPNLEIWLNFGGQFLTTVNLGQEASTTILTFDVDDDSDVDIVSIDNNGGATVRINQGGAFFAAPSSRSQPSPWYPTSYRAVDCDGDGLSDIGATTSEGNVAYCLDNAGGSFISWRTVAAGTGRYRNSPAETAGDLDGDGDADLVWLTHDGTSSDVRLTWSENPNNGTPFAAHLLEASAHSSASLFCYDADGDGDLDIGSLHSRGLDLWENLGSGSAASAITIGAGCGTPPMRMNPTSSPRPGGVMSARIQDTPSPICTITIGFSNSIGPGGATLPIDLTPIGMPGCHIYQSIDDNLGTSSAGVAYERLFAVRLPPDGRLLGTHLYTQAITLSFGVNPLGVVTSNSIDWGIGGQ